MIGEPKREWRDFCLTLHPVFIAVIALPLDSSTPTAGAAGGRSKSSEFSSIDHGQQQQQHPTTAHSLVMPTSSHPLAMTTHVLDAGQELACIDERAAHHIASAVPDYGALVHDAQQASNAERQMGVMQSIRAYPKAVCFSMGISLAIVMEGYDCILLNNFYAQPAFVKRYGDCVLKDDGVESCQISAPWQSGLSNGSQIGSLIGLQLVGWLSDRWGYRKTMMGSLFLMAVFTLIPFLAENLVTLLMGQLLQGIPWGIFQAIAVSYAADVCPVSLRPILTTYVNLCWVMGQLIGSGVLRAVVQRTDKWAYKIPYGESPFGEALGVSACSLVSLYLFQVCNGCGSPSSSPLPF